MPEIDINEFILMNNNQQIGTGALFSHTVSRGKLKSDPQQKVWICKEIQDPALAKLEILAQEFFRVLIPHQPETLIAKNLSTNTHYILSEEVVGYKNLPTGQAENFNNGSFTGLGQVIVGSMFLQEIDLKNGNLGLDDKNQVIKIDGDWCFAEERFPGAYNLTEEAIEKLPYPSGYYTFNWLDLVKGGVQHGISNIVNAQTSVSPQFRSEVNQAMLKICLLPDSFITKFVDTYMPAGGQRFIDIIKSRRDMLKESALKNSSFLDYLSTHVAQQDAVSLISHLKLFANEKKLIVPNLEHKQLEDEFNHLVSSTPVLNEPILVAKNVELLGLLYKVEQCILSPKDILLIKYIQDTRQDIQQNASNLEGLTEIQNKISNILKSVSSSEIKEVQNFISSLRQNANFLTSGENEKADNIENALYKIPLEERGTIITSVTSNPIQEAMAAHRHLGKENVDPKEATKSFKDIKLELENLKNQTNIINQVDADQNASLKK